MAKAIEIDMRLYKMIAQKKGATLNLNLLDYDTVIPADTKSMAGGSGPAPMDIDAVRTGFKTPPLPNQGVPHPQLTLDEKECHHRENLCLYCGQPNHMAVNCLKKASNAQANHSPMKSITMSVASVSSPTPSLLLDVVGSLEVGKVAPQM